jgi:AbrB family looped-hinge helix DNA binding protein
MMDEVRNGVGREYCVSVTSKGQVTIPVDIRRMLGIETPGRVTLVVTETGEVFLRSSRFPTLESLVGYFGTLDQPRPWDEMLEIARAEGAVGADRATDG